MHKMKYIIPILLLSLPVVPTYENCPVSNALPWAPGMRKHVFTTFLNDFNCPTWITRDPFTKATTHRSHRRLPFGTPFAFICGACFTSYPSLATNLTLISEEIQVEFQAIDSKPGITTLHRGKRGDDCLVSLGVSSRVSGKGSITCRLNRGSKSFDEKITFSSVYVPMFEDKLEILEAPGGKAELACPQLEDPTPDTVYVWHTSINQKNQPTIVVPSMRPNVTVTLTSANLSVSCSTYDSRSPNLVRRKTFQLTRAEGGYVGAPQDEKPQSVSIALIAIIVGSITLSIILIALLIGVVSSIRRNYAKPRCPPPSSNLPLVAKKLYNDSMFNS